jgi:Protein of unknown function (DUF3592)
LQLSALVNYSAAMKIFGNKLLTEGRQTEGVILDVEPTSSAPRIKSHVVVGFLPDGGEQVEFRQTISTAVNMPEANLLARLNPDTVPIGVAQGMKVPVRYSAENPSHVVVDEPELQRRAIEAHQRNKEHLRHEAEEQLRRSH